MGTVVLIVLAGWLVLSVLGAIVIGAVARGGNHEERSHRRFRARPSR